LAELFAKEGDLDSNALKNLRAEFERDFDGYVDNLLAPEKHAASLLLMMVCKFELVALAVLSLALESD
jgi:hypothetical protein